MQSTVTPITISDWSVFIPFSAEWARRNLAKWRVFRE